MQVWFNYYPKGSCNPILIFQEMMLPPQNASSTASDVA